MAWSHTSLLADTALTKMKLSGSVKAASAFLGNFRRGSIHQMKTCVSSSNLI